MPTANEIRSFASLWRVFSGFTAGQQDRVLRTHPGADCGWLDGANQSDRRRGFFRLLYNPTTRDVVVASVNTIVKEEYGGGTTGT